MKIKSFLAEDTLIKSETDVTVHMTKVAIVMPADLELEDAASKDETI